MFKNRSIKISLAKDKPGETPTESIIDVEQLAKVAQENAKQAAIGLALIYAGKKVIDTTSQVILIAAEAKFNH